MHTAVVVLVVAQEMKSRRNLEFFFYLSVSKNAAGFEFSFTARNVGTLQQYPTYITRRPQRLVGSIETLNKCTGPLSSTGKWRYPCVQL